MPPKPRRPQKKTALILVEGETEEEYYSRLIRNHCPKVPKKVINLIGNFNINNKIIEAGHKFARNHPLSAFDVFVCIDQERLGAPAYNHNYCTAELKKCQYFGKIVSVVTTLMTESIFFLDIEGIYAFLRAPQAQRKPQNFRNYRQLTHHDLSRLFKAHNKTYRKGRRCGNFLDHLDLDKTLNAEEISGLISGMKEL